MSYVLTFVAGMVTMWLLTFWAFWSERHDESGGPWNG
jgi:hypothetical protein